MNLTGIKSYVSTHGKQVGLGVAAAGATGYALIVKRRKAAALAAATAGTTGPSTTTGTGAAVAGLNAAPDTSATDIENFVQGQLNGFQNDINTQLGNVPAPVVSGAKGYSYIRDLATSTIYSVDKATGVRLPMSAQDYAVAGNPAYITYGTAPPAATVAKAAPRPGPDLRYRYEQVIGDKKIYRVTPDHSREQISGAAWQLAQSHGYTLAQVKTK